MGILSMWRLGSARAAPAGRCRFRGVVHGHGEDLRPALCDAALLWGGFVTMHHISDVGRVCASVYRHWRRLCSALVPAGRFNLRGVVHGHVDDLHPCLCDVALVRAGFLTMHHISVIDRVCVSVNCHGRRLGGARAGAVGPLRRCNCRGAAHGRGEDFYPCLYDVAPTLHVVVTMHHNFLIDNRCAWVNCRCRRPGECRLAAATLAVLYMDMERTYILLSVTLHRHGMWSSLCTTTRS